MLYVHLCPEHVSDTCSFFAHQNLTSYIVSGRYDTRMLDDLMNGVKGFVMNPSETFVKTREKSLGAAYQYYVALLVIFTVLFGLVAVSMGLATFTTMISKLAVIPIIGGVTAGAAANFTGFIIALNVFLVYLVFLALLIGIFVLGLITHVFVLLMGGKKGVEQTIKTTMFASTPALLLGWIPFVSIIGFIWSLVLLVLGIKENQEMTLGNAALVVVIPIVLNIILLELGSVAILAFSSAIAALLPKAFM
jgi:hypothetical protein